MFEAGMMRTVLLLYHPIKCQANLRSVTSLKLLISIPLITSNVPFPLWLVTQTHTYIKFSMKFNYPELTLRIGTVVRLLLTNIVSPFSFSQSTLGLRFTRFGVEFWKTATPTSCVSMKGTVRWNIFVPSFVHFLGPRLAPTGLKFIRIPP